MNSNTRHELLNLVEDFLEGNASESGIARLEALVLSDQECESLYLEVVQLHGNLYWDAAGCGAELENVFSLPAAQSSIQPSVNRVVDAVSWPRRAAALLSTVALLVVLVWTIQSSSISTNSDSTVVENTSTPDASQHRDIKVKQNEGNVVEVRLPQNEALAKHNANEKIVEPIVSDEEILPFDSASDLQVVAFINEQIQSKWDENSVAPSPRATESEWVRRIHLDLLGRIPTPLEVESFLDDSDASKRLKLLDSLLESRGFASNFASIWTNLLVGRSRGRDIDREALFAYLKGQFGNNMPWSKTVTDLISAEGSADQSGPANFLLAHLNNEAVPATAITARIFLCEQIQCSQCHRHPTIPDWGQEKFWEFNAFFQRTIVEEKMVLDKKTGQQQRIRQLVDTESPKAEPAYYEDLRGVMKVAYPRFADVDVKPLPESTLRDQLAHLLTTGSDPQLAQAFVNRSWKHFFGHAFTRQVDDMGPHHEFSHPNLVDGIARAFVKSDYDVRRLIRWICLSDAYQLTSKSVAENKFDEPELGDLPLFTRMYVKPLSPEQLFNSLLIAGGVSTEEIRRRGSSYAQREEWLQQFFVSENNEENGEVSTFDGSLPQTLMMMNGELVKRAIDPVQGQVLKEIVSDRSKSEAEHIQDLCLAALSRRPTPQELEAIQKMLRNQIRLRTSHNMPPQLAYNEAFGDVYWAYLNSSEFSVNH